MSTPDDVTRGADSIAQALLCMDKKDRKAQLKKLKEKHAVTHALVIARMKELRDV